VRVEEQQGAGLVVGVFGVYSGLVVSYTCAHEKVVHVPYKISRRASVTGVGRSTSIARLTIRSKCDKSDVTDANAY
jgi:hypothetical protein